MKISNTMPNTMCLPNLLKIILKPFFKDQDEAIKRFQRIMSFFSTEALKK